MAISHPSFLIPHAIFQTVSMKSGWTPCPKKKQRRQTASSNTCDTPSDGKASFDDTKPMEIPEGYTRFIGDGQQNTFFFPPEECRTGTLSVPLDKWIENAGDSISLDIKALEKWDEENESGKIPPVRIDSKSGKYAFYPTYFWYNPRKGKDSSLQLSGYLFMK